MQNAYKATGEDWRQTTLEHLYDLKCFINLVYLPKYTGFSHLGQFGILVDESDELIRALQFMNYCRSLHLKTSQKFSMNYVVNLSCGCDTLRHSESVLKRKTAIILILYSLQIN